MKDNFKWIVGDIDKTLVLQLFYDDGGNKILYGNYEILDLLDVAGGKLNVKTGNINDITNLLTVSMIRFRNVSDIEEFIDIPLRKLHLLNDNASSPIEMITGSFCSTESLEAFCMIDGFVAKENYMILPLTVGKPTSALEKIIMASKEYSKLDMQEKYDTLWDVNMVNHRRILADKLTDN